MQKKHAWEKVVGLTGNLEEDFDLVIKLLEQHNITNKKFIKGKPFLFPSNLSKIEKVRYRTTINSFEVEAEFETYLETGESYLQDAWVVTK